MIKKILFLTIITLSFLHGSFQSEKNAMLNKDVLLKFDASSEFIEKNMHSLKMNMDKFAKLAHLVAVVKRGKDYVPILSTMLNENGIPKIFLYLALAESNFSPNAVSKKKAVGLWQFMPATAKRFGLKIDDYIDERKDPIKSTKAAIKYLKYLHAEFGKWYLVAMAYNCGGGRVRKAIREANSWDLEVLLDEEKKYIPLQTRVYIRKILSIGFISSDLNTILQNDDDYFASQCYDDCFEVIKVPSGTTLQNISSSIKVSVNKLKKLNPQLNYSFVPFGKKKYNIYIPYGLKTKFEKNFKPHERYEGFYAHIVKKGDTLWDISKQYGIKISVLKQINNLQKSRLKLKQKLIIPVLQNKFYIVQKGDTLAYISKKFSVKLALLEKQTNKKPIKAGDKLVIPFQ